VQQIGNPEITRYSPGIEFIDGLFQATAVRSGGFYVVPIPSVRISLQVLYVIMMYISAFPVAITIRNSNVYEERSLGIYSDDPGYDEMQASGRTFVSWARKRFGGPASNHRGVFVQQQLRAQLAHDLWWLVLAVFLIMIIEGKQFQANPAVFSVFNVIFEVVSGEFSHTPSQTYKANYNGGYGTVGISVGLPDQAYSFCGAWHTISKLILCAVMLRGRHRGLPVAIDKAVLLPNDALNDLEQEDAHIRADLSPHSRTTEF
jgi:Trk-type K+ transport system membrane component